MCERWGGDLSPTDGQYLSKIQELAGPKASWWAKYIGRSAGGIGDLFPAGVIRDKDEKLIRVEAGWTEQESVDLRIEVAIEGVGGAVEDWRRGIEKVGKKKNWVGGRDGWG